MTREKKEREAADAFRTLQVPYGVTAAELKRAFRELVRQQHPDRNDNETNEEHTKELTHAYDVLGNGLPEKLERARELAEAPAKRREAERRAEEAEAVAAARRRQRAPASNAVSDFDEAIRGNTHRPRSKPSEAPRPSAPRARHSERGPEQTVPNRPPVAAAAPRVPSTGRQSLHSTTTQATLMDGVVKTGGGIVGAIKGAAVGFVVALALGILLELFVPLSHAMSSASYNVGSVLIMVGGAVIGFIGGYGET